MKPLIYVVALAVALVRPFFLCVDFNHHVDASYQAIAHLLVGGLFASYFTARSRDVAYGGGGYAAALNDWKIDLAVLLSGVEVICAIAAITLRTAL